MLQISDMATLSPGGDLRSRILARLQTEPDRVWTPNDFIDLAGRASVDKTLQRLADASDIRRIDRGLYDCPRKNGLTGKDAVPDYRAVIKAVTRRDQARFVVDGMTAANDLGLTNAVPARIEVLVDTRLKPIRLGNQEVFFKAAAPSRLFWAGRPAMRIVQALYWLQDVLGDPEERLRIVAILRPMLDNKKHGAAIRNDLVEGFSSLPIWMQKFLRDLIMLTKVNVPDVD